MRTIPTYIKFRPKIKKKRDGEIKDPTDDRDFADPIDDR